MTRQGVRDLNGLPTRPNRKAEIPYQCDHRRLAPCCRGPKGEWCDHWECPCGLQWDDGGENEPRYKHGREHSTFLDEYRAQAHEILAAIYASANDEDPDAGLDVIYARLDDALSAGEIVPVKIVLIEVMLSRLPLVHCLALASITAAAHDQMPWAREELMRRLRKRIEQTDPKRVDQLLDGLVVHKSAA